MSSHIEPARYFMRVTGKPELSLGPGRPGKEGWEFQRDRCDGPVHFAQLHKMVSSLRNGSVRGALGQFVAQGAARALAHSHSQAARARKRERMRRMSEPSSWRRGGPAASSPSHPRARTSTCALEFNSEMCE
eukprot:1178490-Pleurochrysis_carterae.AAC.1